jgi:hypothetical protein
MKLKKLAVGAATAAALILPTVVFGQQPIGADDLGMQQAGAIGLGSRDIRETVGAVIRAFMGLLGIVAVCIILLGGFKWMTAMGEDTKVQEAKKLITAGVIGLVIILSAYAIATFVVGAIINGTTG